MPSGNGEIDIANGDYVFTVTDSNGSTTTGEVVRGGLRVTASAANTNTSLDTANAQFLVSPAFFTRDDFASLTSALKMQIFRASFAPDGTLAPGDSVGLFDAGTGLYVWPGQLTSGLYTAVYEDDFGAAAVEMSLELSRTALNDPLLPPALPDPSAQQLTNMDYYPGTVVSPSGSSVVVHQDGVGLAADPTDFTDYTDATGAVFHDVRFFRTGTLVSQLYDLFPGSGTIGVVATAPPNALAGMISFVPYSPSPTGQSALGASLDPTAFPAVPTSNPQGVPGQVNANFNLLQMGTLPDANRLPPSGPETGMSMTWSVATSKDLTGLIDASGIVAWSRIGRRDILEAAIGNVTAPLIAQDTPAPAPILLRRYLRLQLQMTRSTIPLGTTPPGGASPEVFGLGIQPTITWMRLLDTSGVLYLVPSADGNCAIVSDTPQLTCALAGTGNVPPPPSQLVSGGPAYLVDPPTVQLGAQGTFKFNISTAAVNAANLDPASLTLYSAAPGQPFTRVPHQSLDLAHGVVTGFITQIQLDTYFQIFGRARPAAAKPEAPTATFVVNAATRTLTIGWNARTNAPYTEFQVFYASSPSAQVCDASNAVFTSALSFGTTADLTALAPDQPYLVQVCNPALGASGCDSMIQVNTTAAGVVSRPNFTVCSSTTALQQPPYAMAADAQGRLWEAYGDGQGGVLLGLFDAAGNSIAENAIPNATTAGNWRIAFDPAGNAYAVGPVLGPDTRGLDVGVAKFDADDNLLANNNIDGGFGLLDIPFDATATASALWITGASQTGGTSPGAPGFAARLGLWRYDFATGLLAPATSYSGPGALDGGLAIAQAADGGLYVVGLSSRPETAASAKLAQAVWRFDASGRLVQGPWLVPAYLSDLRATGAAAVVSSGTLLAAMSRAAGAGNVGLGVTAFRLADGRVMAQGVWSAPNADALPAAAAVSPSGRWTIAGAVSSRSHGDAAVWTFGLDGGFLSAQAATFYGNSLMTAAGLAYNSGGAWIAAGSDGVPYAFAGGPGLSGAFGPVDVLPPRTSLVVGSPHYASSPTYVSPATPLGFAAVDDELVVGDGAGVGVARTLYAVDAGSFAVYSGTFAPPSAGLHALRFYSVDLVDNAEAVHVASIAVDAAPPVTTAAVGTPSYAAADGALYVATTTPVSFAASDPPLAGSTVPGSGVNRIEVSIDSAAWTPYSAALAFAEGAHVILYRAVDNVGNVEAAHALALRADATPPVSTLAIGSPQFALSSAAVLVSSLTPIGVTAVDPVSSGVASGVRQSFYSVGGGTFAVLTASFTLAPPDGPQTIAFYSQDNVLNTEAVKASTVVLDATPPAVALLSPGACPGGLCRVVKGRFPVLGSATDAHFAGYVLDFAPGQNAATGYALISSGTVAVSSAALGTWDASALAGWQTLRLTAVDLVANTAVIAVNVFVGDPGELMALGNHDVFDLPQGVAADAAGNVYVADTNADRIAVFSATGTFLAAFGRHEDDGPRNGVRLHRPRGVAVDGTGNVYVADTEADRVLKLSATGYLLLAVGRRPGRGPGEFDKPSSVALDAAGNIFVADTNNGRVQKLGPDGTPLAAFPLPPPAARADADRDERPATGRPVGLALDAAGHIYVADPAGGRALVFGATGQLLLTLPIAGTSKDAKTLPGRPSGIAVSTDGYCLLVSDQRFDRVLKFDALGDQTLVFGAPAKRDEGRKLGAGIFLRKPTGLALAPDGTLLVADRNDDRILRFGLPTGAPTLVVPPRAERDEDARDVLDRDGGGRVARRDGAGVAVPPGALPDDLKITVSTLSPASAAQAGAMDQVAVAKGLKPAYAPVEYGPEGTTFAAPVVLTVPYNPQMLAAQGLAEDSLKVHYWNKLAGDWEALESVVDKAAHTVTAKTPHFSLYQVLGSTGAGYGVLAADASFGLKAAYAFPNPVHSGAVTLRIQPGLADAVSVRVYDVSGRKVHDSSGFSLSTLDDGNGLGAQFTYDHVWDVSGVGSGVYTYVITATKAGQTDIHKTGRIGVAK